MSQSSPSQPGTASGNVSLVHLKCDVVVIGAGAAGLMAAIQAGRMSSASPRQRIIAIDSASSLGAKILVAGGGRCNVTHEQVCADDYCSATASKNSLRNILRRFTVEETIAFFAQCGVELKREETGKLFPVTDAARTILNALLSAAEKAQVHILTEHPVHSVSYTEGESPTFAIRIPTRSTTITARKLILATGGKAMPKTGSDGHGYSIAQSLGHSLTSQVFPALVPLTLPQEYFTCALQGVSHHATFAVQSSRGKKVFETTNDFVCTHFGLSGPAVLDISRHYRAAIIDDPGATLQINFLPGVSFAECDLQLQRANQKKVVRNVLRDFGLPERLARAILENATLGMHLDDSVTLSQLRKEQRKHLTRTLTEHVLPIAGHRGFKFAEVTAGGVPLNEVNIKTMESKCTPGLYLCGEILDVDGRIGGFNFQWAWTTGTIAGRSV